MYIDIETILKELKETTTYIDKAYNKVISLKFNLIDVKKELLIKIKDIVESGNDKYDYLTIYEKNIGYIDTILAYIENPDKKDFIIANIYEYVNYLTVISDMYALNIRLSRKKNNTSYIFGIPEEELEKYLDKPTHIKGN